MFSRQWGENYAQCFERVPPFVLGRLDKVRVCPASADFIEVAIESACGGTFRWCFSKGGNARTAPDEAVGVVRLGYKPALLVLDQRQVPIRPTSVGAALASWRSDGPVLVERALV